jgi:hypothetical protein
MEKKRGGGTIKKTKGKQVFMGVEKRNLKGGFIMCQKKTVFKYVALIVAIIALVGLPAVSKAVPPKDTLTVTALTSENHKDPATIGSNWVYAYTLDCNSKLIDTLHVELTISNTHDPSGESYSIGLSKTGTPAIRDYTTLPTPNPFSLSDDGVTVTKDISIATDALAPGDYTLNINIGTPPSALIEPNAKDGQVRVHVNKCGASVSTCFFTDSNGVFLANCDGELVSDKTGGTFMLVDKKNGTIIATNPGQFYYNYIWTNDGSAVDVQVLLGDLANIVPHGANAVHAYTFDTSGFTQDVGSFNMVNNDGTPCGPSGPCTVNVGVGETLWVTWHLEYAGVGSAKPGAGNSCPGYENIGAAAELVDAVTGGAVAGKCTTSATGYNKQ